MDEEYVNVDMDEFSITGNVTRSNLFVKSVLPVFTYLVYCSFVVETAS